jgi:hypothetical protein
MQGFNLDRGPDGSNEHFHRLPSFSSFLDSLDIFISANANANANANAVVLLLLLSYYYYYHHHYNNNYYYCY